MIKYFLFLFIPLLSITSVETRRNFTSLDLDYVIAMHEAYCELSPKCAPTLVRPPPVFHDNGSVTFPELPNIPPLFPKPPVPSDGSCCESCSCDLEFCVPTGMCCPDTLDYLPSVEESVSKLKQECIYASLKKIKIPITLETPRVLSVWMYTKCADDFSGSPVTRGKCEEPGQVIDLDTDLPVIDNITQNIYRNSYCGLCNNVQEKNMVYWDASIECSEGVLLPTSVKTVVDEVNAAPDCNIFYKFPSTGMILPECTYTISECNVTGRWEVYDPVIEAACHAYTAVFKSKTTYNNIFCFLCNEPFFSAPGICYPMAFYISVSFSALLRFKGPPQQVDVLVSEEGASKCNDVQIYDPLKEVCRNLFCAPPKTLQAGICINTVKYLNGVTFEAFLELTPDETDIPIRDFNKTASAAWGIYQQYFISLGVSQLVYVRNMYFQRSTQNSELMEKFILHCKVYFEESDTLIYAFVNSLLSLDNGTRVFVGGNTTAFKMTLGYYGTNTLNKDSTNALGNLESGSLHRITGIFPVFVNDTEPILVNKILDCPQVKLEPSEYSFEFAEKTIYIKGNEAEFQHDIYRIINASNELTVYMCADDFIAHSHQLIASTMAPTRSTVDTVTPQGILSVVCTCISLLCLFFTLITYLLFQELRTQPGINNIALVISLIIAQTLFQFGTGQAAVVSEWGCQVIGVLVHFFWLMVMFWLNVCCIHMFRVFSAIKNSTGSKKTWKQTFIYSAYTVGFSTILVLLNIIPSVYHSDYEGIGYGGTICYITDYRMVGYVFAIPVGLVLSANLALFIAVIVKIHRTPVVKSDTKSTRNYFAIYAKLSTITGITWLFGFIYTFTDVEALEYVFNIFNAGQGAFLFLAFVCNKRVLGMYRYKLKSGLPDSLVSTMKTAGNTLTDTNTKV